MPIDDIFDVIDEEVTEDFERMAGVIDSSDQEYLDISVWKHVKNRMPWLFLLMCSYMITGGIIQNFENVLSNVIALVTYMPMLMGTGGNSDSQSATLVIRGSGGRPGRAARTALPRIQKQSRPETPA